MFNLSELLIHPVVFVLCLTLSNVFMTFAWYGHLKNFADRPWWIAVLASWGIAFFEYLLQVPGNRVGFMFFSLAQLKIIQEVITLSVFIPFSIYYMNQPFKWNYLLAGLCLLGAVYFMFKS
ncbi:MAG: DMT family protein [Betaproteobacteria bacterium]|nr:DMT family protein [Betaproteobacteria bacterium]MDE2423910.1 DMT family protein [Betaproteobacteria bacterium]